MALDIVIACCRDEEDIISTFIDFYLDMGFDTICLIDNGSRDHTVKQILSHPAHDCISLLVDRRIGYDKRLLEYYQTFANRATRWCFFIDVDEFIVIPGGIKNYAKQIPDEVTAIRLGIVEMLPIIESSPTNNPLLTCRRESSFQKEHKIVWKKSSNVSTIYCGKHQVILEPYHEHYDENLYIRHYHTRSKQQFIRKITNRVETEESFNDDERKKLSPWPFDPSHAWLNSSRQFIQPDGWEKEKKRIKKTPWIVDSVFQNWFIQNARCKTKLLQTNISPVIPLSIGNDMWHSFCIRDYRCEEGHTAEEHLVLVYGVDDFTTDLQKNIFSPEQDISVRIHSECLFGDVFGTDRCDCGQQLAYALDTIVRGGVGIIIYMRQEGRGIGLYNKIRSLNLDESNSFTRNEMLGLAADKRDYTIPATILFCLGVRKARLMSGNPAKLAALQDIGIQTIAENCIVTEDISSEAYQDLVSKISRGYNYSI